MAQNLKNGWSFIIVTAPRTDLAQLSKTISSIEKQDLPHYEIIVVGDNPKLDVLPQIKHQAFKETRLIRKGFLRRLLTLLNEFRLQKPNLINVSGAISEKKNTGARQAKFDKLCIMHDYIILNDGWKRGVEKFSKNWDILLNPVYNQDGKRFRDWCNWDYMGTEPCHQDYEISTQRMYCSGTYFCAKTDFFLEHPFDERLYWGEGEDVEWSLRIQKHTTFKFNHSSSVKFSKLKSLKEAPYCKKWTAREIHFQTLFAQQL